MNNKAQENQCEHTPGPWQVYGCAVYQADCWNAGRNEGGKRIGSTFDGSPEDEGDRMPTDEQGANARLISAAPDLLEACKKARQALITLKAWGKVPMSVVMLEYGIQELTSALEKASAQ